LIKIDDLVKSHPKNLSPSLPRSASKMGFLGGEYNLTY